MGCCLSRRPTSPRSDQQHAGCLCAWFGEPVWDPCAPEAAASTWELPSLILLFQHCCVEERGGGDWAVPFPLLPSSCIEVAESGKFPYQFISTKWVFQYQRWQLDRCFLWCKSRGRLPSFSLFLWLSSWLKQQPSLSTFVITAACLAHRLGNTDLSLRTQAWNIWFIQGIQLLHILQYIGVFYKLLHAYVNLLNKIFWKKSFFSFF